MESIKSENTIVKKDYKYSELTGKIIGCSMEVHKILGNGFQEVIYQRALEKEMSLQWLSFSREYEMPIFYKDEQMGTRRVDFLVEGNISVEIKAVTKLEDVHLAQAINYLEAYNLEIGLLINFGSKSLEFKRVINSRFKNHGSSN
jgi:GxxExxY protein